MAAKGLISLSDVPEMEGWLTLPEAAAELGISRTRTADMVREGKITTCMRLGRRPYFVVREVEIRQIKADRDRKAEASG